MSVVRATQALLYQGLTVTRKNIPTSGVDIARKFDCMIRGNLKHPLRKKKLWNLNKYQIFDKHGDIVGLSK